MLGVRWRTWRPGWRRELGVGEGFGDQSGDILVSATLQDVL